MKRLLAWLLPVLATLVGIVVGAGLNDYFAGQRETTGRLAELQSDAYAEFFRGQALLSRDRDNEENRAAANEIVDRAKLQIAIWAPPTVINAMNEYWRKHHNADKRKCPDAERNTLDARIYQTMRAEALGEDNVPIDDKDMVTFLFLCNLTENQGE